MVRLDFLTLATGCLPSDTLITWFANSFNYPDDPSVVRDFFEVSMPGKTIRTDKMVQDILDRVSAGETLTSICKIDGLPCLSSLMVWLRDDHELDDRMHRARIRGTLIQADEAVDAQRGVINGTTGLDPKALQAVVTAANNMGHQANAKLSKIDNRYKDKQQVEHTGPMVIGWEAESQEERVIPDVMLDAVTDDRVRN